MTMVYVNLCSHIFGVLSEYFSNREVKVKEKKQHTGKKKTWQNFQIHPVLGTPSQKLDFFFLSGEAVARSTEWPAGSGQSGCSSVDYHLSRSVFYHLGKSQLECRLAH